MSTYDFERSSGVRIRPWLDELPPVPPSLQRNLWNIESVSGGIARPRHARATIECFRHYGGMFHYGLLGAEFASDPPDNLFRVRVPTPLPKSPTAWSGSLNEVAGDASIGFSKEYIPAIFEGVRQLQSELPSGGVLTFITMVHSEVGSAHVVFRALAKGIVRLLFSSQPYETAKDALALLD